MRQCLFQCVIDFNSLRVVNRFRLEHLRQNIRDIYNLSEEHKTFNKIDIRLGQYNFRSLRIVFS